MIGAVGPNTSQPIHNDCKNAHGVTRVVEEKCETCPYRPGSSFNYQLKRIHEATLKGGFNICHNSFPDDVEFAVCRGSFDAFKERFEDKSVMFIEEQKSSYVVLPFSVVEINHEL